MATNYTNNYQLCQWEPEDQVNRLEFNQDNSRIEAGLLDVANKVDEAKAIITSNVSSLENQILQVSNNLITMEDSISTLQSNLTTLQSNYTALNSSLTTVSTKADSAYTLASSASTTANSAYSASNPNIVMGYYTGVGYSRYVGVGFYPTLGIILEETGTISESNCHVMTYEMLDVDSKVAATYKCSNCQLYYNGFYANSLLNVSGKRYIYILMK